MAHTKSRPIDFLAISDCRHFPLALQQVIEG